MRMHAALMELGQSSPSYCALNTVNTAYDPVSGLCVPPSGPTPPYSTTPGLPVGYDPTTGTVTSTTGITQVQPGPGGQTGPGTTNPDILAIEEAQNASNAAACKQKGGVWDSVNGVCNTTNYWPLYIGLALGALFLFGSLSRR